LQLDDETSNYYTFGESDLKMLKLKVIINLLIRTLSGIDVEYTIPEGKSGGYKYKLIVHSGAGERSLSKVKLTYSGDIEKCILIMMEILLLKLLSEILLIMHLKAFINLLIVKTS